VDDTERELGWLAFPWPRDLSADGRRLLFDEEGETAGPTYAVYLRDTDGSPPVQLGEGAACALSPDGRSALAIHYGPPHQLVSISTVSADRLFLPRGPVETYQHARWLPAGRQVVFTGAERGRPQRTWVQEYPGGLPTAVTPEGTVGVTTSPDGRWVAAVTQELELGIYPLEGGEPRRVATLAPREFVSQWSSNGRTLFAGRKGDRLEAFGIDVRNGQRKPWRTIEVPDPAGVYVSSFIVTRDGRSYAYGYLRLLDELYLVDDLR
jgi:hypothetical protein